MRGRTRTLRLIAGAVLAGVLVLVVLTLLGQAHDTRGALTTLRAADPALVAAAAGAEAASYLAMAVVLALLVPGLALPVGAGIAVAAFGAGSLVPGQPAGGIAVTVRELARRGLPVRRAAPTAAALLAGVPAASMAVLAGPTLLASAAWAPLPGGWRTLVAVLGGCALPLGGAVALTVVSPAWLRRARPRPSALVDRSRDPPPQGPGPDARRGVLGRGRHVPVGRGAGAGRAAAARDAADRVRRRRRRDRDPTPPGRPRRRRGGGAARARRRAGALRRRRDRRARVAGALVLAARDRGPLGCVALLARVTPAQLVAGGDGLAVALDEPVATG